MKKTPEEIEAMAKEQYPGFTDVLECGAFIKGYTSNTELEDFKKRLVEKVEALMKSYRRDNDVERGKDLAYEEILDLITQDDQPPLKKEEKT